MKDTQENLSTLTIWSCNVTTSTREPPTCAWIRADIWRQDGAICSKNRKIVPYHRCARIPRLTVSVPDYGSCIIINTANYLILYSNFLHIFLFSRQLQLQLQQVSTHKISVIFFFICVKVKDSMTVREVQWIMSCVSQCLMLIIEESLKSGVLHF